MLRERKQPVRYARVIRGGLNLLRVVWPLLDNVAFTALDMRVVMDRLPVGTDRFQVEALLSGLVEAGVLLMDDAGLYRQGYPLLAIYLRSSELRRPDMRPIGYFDLRELSQTRPSPAEPVAPVVKVADRDRVANRARLNGHPAEPEEEWEPPELARLTKKETPMDDAKPQVEPRAEVYESAAKFAAALYPELDESEYAAVDRTRWAREFNLVPTSITSLLRQLSKAGVLQRQGERNATQYRRGNPLIQIVTSRGNPLEQLDLRTVVAQAPAQTDKPPTENVPEQPDEQPTDPAPDGPPAAPQPKKKGEICVVVEDAPTAPMAMSWSNPFGQADIDYARLQAIVAEREQLALRDVELYTEYHDLLAKLNDELSGLVTLQ